MRLDRAAADWGSEAKARATKGMTQLVRQAQAGDRGAFEQLYREHVGRVYALCLRLSADATTAEELTQETFVKAWRKLSAFRGDSAFSSWLYRIAANTAFQSKRSENRRHARIVTADNLERVDGRAGEVSVNIDLERAIRALPPGARSVFILHDIEGYAHEDIAGMTGVAVGTSKAQLHRARRLLREALER